MSKKKRVLVVGVGSIGERHLRCFQQTGRADVSVCEINDRLRGDVADRYSVPAASSNLDEALAHDPEVAVICTPAHLHIPMAIRLAEAGVHLLIEKPLSTSLDGLDRLQAIVEQRQLTAGVAYVYRAHPVLSQMREAVLEGRFGEPVQLVAVSGQHFPHYRPAYREIYYRDRATGGGAIQDALTHVVNAAQWLVGPMTQVAADAEHQVLEGVEVEDTVNVVARHGNLQASYSLNQHQAPNEGTITVICRSGVARFETHRHRWRWQTTPEQPWNDVPFEPLERDELFVRQASAFLDSVELRQPAACSLEEGKQTLRANLAILKSADTRTWQAIE